MLDISSCCSTHGLLTSSIEYCMMGVGREGEGGGGIDGRWGKDGGREGGREGGRGGKGKGGKVERA